MVALNRDMLSRIRVNGSWASGVPRAYGRQDIVSALLLGCGGAQSCSLQVVAQSLVWSPERTRHARHRHRESTGMGCLLHDVLANEPLCFRIID